MINENKLLLKVTVGSQAHGLATPESDFDYRGIFVAHTRDILSIGGTTQQTSWIEGKDDDTSWEVGKFLKLATQCNPTILETFLAPVNEITPYGEKIRELFPHIWNSVDVMNAFIGYGLNQRKKFLEDKDKRRNKYAAAYLRTLFNANELLRTGQFSVDLRGSEIYDTVRAFKTGDYQLGDVINVCMEWEQKVREAFELNPDKKTDLNKVNALLLEIRYFYW